jgi:hypothetical protein
MHCLVADSSTSLSICMFDTDFMSSRVTAWEDGFRVGSSCQSRDDCLTTPSVMTGLSASTTDVTRACWHRLRAPHRLSSMQAAFETPVSPAFPADAPCVVTYCCDDGVWQR